MIRHIVFDMGQVLVNFNIGLFTDRLRLSEADAALIRREVLTTVEWVRMDRGTISEDDALARMQACPSTCTVQRSIWYGGGTTPSCRWRVWPMWPVT